MKLLWLTVDRSHRVANHFDDFRNTVMNLSNITVTVLFKSLVSDKGQNIWKLSRDLISGELKLPNILLPHLKENDYDFIFCDAFFAYLDEDWDKITIPSSIFIEDIHQEVPKHQIQKAKEYGIKTIFHRFNFAFHKFHPKAKFDFNCIWLPHSILMSRFIDHLSKSIGVLHVGVCPKEYYPNRYNVVNKLRDKSYFKLIPRPQDTPGTDRNSKWPIDRDYDNLLQSAYITITGGSIFDAPVQKYVEIPAANSLLMSNWFPDLGLLGFVPDLNMVTYNDDNVVEKVESLLKDKDKIKQISANGHYLILMHHTSEIRARQFINFICLLLNKPKLYDIEPCSHQINFKPVGIKHTVIKNTTKKETLPTGSDWRSRIKRNAIIQKRKANVL